MLLVFASHKLHETQDTNISFFTVCLCSFRMILVSFPTTASLRSTGLPSWTVASGC